MGGRAVTVLISTERLTRIEFPETPRSVFLSRSDISIEKEDRSLYLRALLPDTQDTLFVVGESGTTYEINLSTSDKPDQTVLISHIPKSLEVQDEKARQVPALDLMRSMMLALPVDGYEIMKAELMEVYRDAFFSMKLVQIYRSPVLHGYVIEVENLGKGRLSKQGTATENDRLTHSALRQGSRQRAVSQEPGKILEASVESWKFRLLALSSSRMLKNSPFTLRQAQGERGRC
ncbi:MAG: type-F conjugative transfer system secretin TraK [Deltaproteobacteria bacterium]|nr:type-F conjugative transfer system secretin TraK [Deltaproteobacteria bacterium]